MRERARSVDFVDFVDLVYFVYKSYNFYIFYIFYKITMFTLFTKNIKLTLLTLLTFAHSNGWIVKNYYTQKGKSVRKLLFREDKWLFLQHTEVQLVT